MPAPPRPSQRATSPVAPALSPEQSDEAPARAQSASAETQPQAAEPQNAPAQGSVEWEVELGATLSGERLALDLPKEDEDKPRGPRPAAGAPAVPVAKEPEPEPAAPPPPPALPPARAASPSAPALPPAPPIPGSVPAAPRAEVSASRRSSPGLSAVATPSGDSLRRTSPGMGMPLVVPAGGMDALRRSSSGLPAASPPSLEDLRRSSPGFYIAQEPTSDGLVEAERSSSSSSNAVITGQITYAPDDFIGGKYRLERVLGQGGMGAVWVAKNLALDSDVALKLIRRDRASEEAAARLLTEARAAAKLGHPGIVRVFDFGLTELGDPYLVMELLNGESLAAVIARKRKLDATIAIQTLLPVAAALNAAHAKGIVHRDLKPDNIMLSTEEPGKIVPKVLDFGIARVLRDDVERHVTIAGEVLGSPDYMSPEQARGEVNVDHRTDIWTFSVLLYETMTGKRPFDGPNYNALIAAIVSATPMPTHAHGAGDAALWAIIERGLAKDAKARWQSMRDMGVALAGWAVERGIQQDISGLSLQTEWLAPKARRLFTVQPPDPRSLRAGVPQGVLTPSPVSAHIARAQTEEGAQDWKDLRGNKRNRLLIAGAVVLAFGGFFLVRGLLSGAPSAGSVSATQPEASAAVVPPAPTPTPPPAPTPSAEPSSRPAPTSTAKAATTPRATTTQKTKAPPVPKNIKF